MNMNEYNPLISIIVPVYNVEKYLPDCLDSIINQSYINIEILCINDGSEDNSDRILKEYAQRDNRIRVFEQENAGLSAARNVGVDYANGKYVLFVDSDDMLAANAVEHIVNKMEYDELDLLCFDVDLLNENSSWSIEEFDKYKNSFVRKYEYNEVKSGSQLFVEMQNNGDFQQPVWLFCVKKSVLEQHDIRFEEGLLHEDVIYSVMCYLNSDKSACLNEKCYIYRVRANTLARIQGSKWRLDSLIWLYYLLLEQINKYQKNDLLVEALCSYTKDLVRSIQTEKNKLLYADNTKLKADNAVLDALYCGLRIGEFQRMDFDRDVYIKGFLQVLDEANIILIYGAGNYGKLVYEFLINNGYEEKIYGFVVSEKNTESDTYISKEIYDLHELPEELILKNPLVVISTDITYHDEIRYSCLDMGLSNILPLDYSLQWCVEHQVKD